MIQLLSSRGTDEVTCNVCSRLLPPVLLNMMLGKRMEEDTEQDALFGEKSRHSHVSRRVFFALKALGFCHLMNFKAWLKLSSCSCASMCGVWLECAQDNTLLLYCLTLSSSTHQVGVSRFSRQVRHPPSSFCPRRPFHPHSSPTPADEASQASYQTSNSCQTCHTKSQKTPH